VHMYLAAFGTAVWHMLPMPMSTPDPSSHMGSLPMSRRNTPINCPQQVLGHMLAMLLLESSCMRGWRPGMLLSTLQCPRHPHHREPGSSIQHAKG
jgi:hypothetical protein